MFWDKRTAADLDLAYCLNQLQPLTPWGLSQSRDLKPFGPGEEERWRRTLEEQERLAQAFERQPDAEERLVPILRGIPDVRGSLDNLKGAEALTATEFYEWKQCLRRIKEWNETVIRLHVADVFGIPSADRPLLEELLSALNPAPPFRSSFSIDDAYDGKLAEKRRLLAKREVQLHEQREKVAQKVEQEYGVRRNRFGEWVVDRERDRERLAALKADSRIICVRETAYDAVFQLGPVGGEMLEREWLHLKEEVQALEQAVLSRLTETFRPHARVLEHWLIRLAHFDLQWARLRASRNWQGVKPVWNPDSIEIEEGFHPSVKEHLAEKGEAMTPISCVIERGATVIIGPNMGGKTVALKTIGLIVALSQLGFFVPAKRASHPLVPWVISLLGDQQSMEAGLSSFGAEMVRLKEALECEGTGLLLLDEIGRGTNPVEGAALAQAVTQTLAEAEHWAVHVTHYREVLMLPDVKAYRVAGLKKQAIAPGTSGGAPSWESATLRQLQAVMDYRLVPLKRGESVPLEGLWIAERLGLPQPIVRLARTYMKKGGGENWKES